MRLRWHYRAKKSNSAERLDSLQENYLEKSVSNHRYFIDLAACLMVDGNKSSLPTMSCARDNLRDLSMQSPGEKEELTEKYFDQL